MPYGHASSLSGRSHFLYHVFGNMHRRAVLRRWLGLEKAVEAVWLATVPHRAKVRAGFTVEQMASAYPGIYRSLPGVARNPAWAQKAYGPAALRVVASHGCPKGSRALF